MGAWFIGTALLIILVFLAIAFHFSFNDPLSMFMGAIGIILAFFVNGVYCADKINAIEEIERRENVEKLRDEQLKYIHKICKQWDRERDSDLQF